MSAGDVYLISNLDDILDPSTAASADPNADLADPTSDPTSSTSPSAANANVVCPNNVCNSKHDA